jgi:ribosomal protein S27E
MAHATLHLAPVAKPVYYEWRRLEETVLYQIVQEHLETFLTQVEAHTGASVPEFVKAEFDAFLERGILAHGFLRLRCSECAHEKLVAFSCKRRGLCPSCGARRMVESAAHLVDQIIPGGRCVNGCFRSRFHCAFSWPPTPNCSQRCCRSSIASLPPS